MDKNEKGVLIIDIGEDVTSALTLGVKVLKQKGIFMTSMFITSVREQTCIAKNSLEDRMPDLSRVYSWVSSDPEGKRQSQGLIMRQGLTTSLINKGLKRIKALFEGDILKIAIGEQTRNVDAIPMFSGKTDYYSILKCMSKTVNYNSIEVEKVNTENFRYLHLLCVLIFICAFIVLILEIYMKNRQTTVTAL